MNFDTTVLVVDDDIFIRRSMVRVIRKNLGEIRFLEAGDGEEAVKLLKNEEVHLMILDLVMPKLDGFGVLEWLHNSGKYENLPVIVNSGNSDWESMQNAFTLGARDYFLKPLTFQQMSIFLPLKIKNALTLYENTQELRLREKALGEELRIARAFQQTLLPPAQAINEKSNCSYAYRYVPASEIGGDFFDFVHRKGAAWFVFVDVTGHGVGAAMGTGMSKLLFLEAIKEANSPGEALEMANNALFTYFGEEPLLSFTAMVGKIEDRELSIASAGHPWPIYCDTVKGRAYPLELSGFPIGYFPQRTYETYTYPMNPGDSLVTASDGLIDQCGGLNAWRDMVASKIGPEKIRSFGAREILENLSNVFWPFGAEDADGPDDATLVVFHTLRDDESPHAPLSTRGDKA